MLHDEQAKIVARAVGAAKAKGPFEGTQNDNANGNALARICEAYLKDAVLWVEEQSDDG